MNAGMVHESEIEAFKCPARLTKDNYTRLDVAGGIASPRHYGGVSKEPLLSPSHSHSTCPATPTHNQHNATNTQHFTSQQHTSMLYQHQHTNANTINTADMQNNQFCYDRSSVPLYPSGGEAQDARSLPSANNVNHQIGEQTLDYLMSCDYSSFFFFNRNMQYSQPRESPPSNSLVSLRFSLKNKCRRSFLRKCNYHHYHHNYTCQQ